MPGAHGGRGAAGPAGGGGGGGGGGGAGGGGPGRRGRCGGRGPAPEPAPICASNGAGRSDRGADGVEVAQLPPPDVLARTDRRARVPDAKVRDSDISSSLRLAVRFCCSALLSAGARRLRQGQGHR